MSVSKINKAKLLSKKIRLDLLEISQKTKAIHIGGSFSSVELIVSIYFFFKKKKDTFILSKGHAGILQYILLNNLGIIKKNDTNATQTFGCSLQPWKCL